MRHLFFLFRREGENTLFASLNIKSWRVLYFFRPIIDVVGRQVGPICIDHELVAFCRSLKSIFGVYYFVARSCSSTWCPWNHCWGTVWKGAKTTNWNTRLTLRRHPISCILVPRRGRVHDNHSRRLKSPIRSKFTILDPFYQIKLRVGEITSWSKVKTVKNTCNCRYFQIYEHFTPKILFGFGSHVHLKTTPHGPHIFWPYFGAVTTPNWQKTGNDEVSSSLCTNGKWAKTKKRVRTAKKTIWTMISVTSGWTWPMPTRWCLK